MFVCLKTGFDISDPSSICHELDRGAQMDGFKTKLHLNTQNVSSNLVVLCV